MTRGLLPIRFNEAVEIGSTALVTALLIKASNNNYLAGEYTFAIVTGFMAFACIFSVSHGYLVSKIDKSPEMP